MPVACQVKFSFMLSFQLFGADVLRGHPLRIAQFSDGPSASELKIASTPLILLY